MEKLSDKIARLLHERFHVKQAKAEKTACEILRLTFKHFNILRDIKSKSNIK